MATIKNILEQYKTEDLEKVRLAVRAAIGQAYQDDKPDTEISLLNGQLTAVNTERNRREAEVRLNAARSTISLGLRAHILVDDAGINADEALLQGMTDAGVNTVVVTLRFAGGKLDMTQPDAFEFALRGSVPKKATGDGTRPSKFAVTIDGREYDSKSAAAKYLTVELGKPTPKNDSYYSGLFPGLASEYVKAGHVVEVRQVA